MGEEIKDAQIDLRYLLNRGYHKKGALKFVADSYQLDINERNFLTRKIFSTQKSGERKKKLVNILDLQNQIMLIDGYNVLITLETVLYHEKTLIKSDDGVLRDFKAIFGKYKPHKTTEKTLSTLINFLKAQNPKEVLFLYDSPVSLSGELSKLTQKHMSQKSLKGFSKTSKTVDSEIIKLSEDLGAIVSTSDGVIIDKVDRVVDLPAAIYQQKKNKKG
jgi:hypothetical protein